MNTFLDDRCLANFIAIYEHGNISRAAEIVLLTQPALSKSLHRLENDLNVLLFVRRSRGLFPTEAGHELYNCAKKIETETRRSLVRIAGLDSGLRGRIRVGAGQMWSWVRIPGAIHEFMSIYLNLDVDLVTAPMESLVTQLESGAVDIAVGDMTDVKVPHGCHEFKFPPGTQLPFASQNHPLAGSTDADLSDLVRYPWIGFYNDNVFTRNVLAICTKAGVPLPNIPLRASSLAAILSVVKGGQYVIILPEEFAAIATKFGITSINFKQLNMWSLSTSALYYENEYNIGPIQTMINIMEKSNIHLG
ncbi:LysR family transcriptional regulator [Devosia rhodophyticola]|uniref:LysR family transcriptional regulator n=1 Tax=Devosia rhodophyticola TaxID=3026423 RepID=A0ABY7YZD1_9HYPH|nr:LysR family transcriptional regulator [Devosia rhodophyticola]WDR06135.1 LysR family transcriptional regulator [Devosia rhodophyticola]